MISDLSEVILLIKRIKSANQFNRYIDFIRFPFYRNLEIDTIINFDFPLTVFIGQNGCGKSSCLHALFGAPKNYTPYSFWFDTKVDPITYYNDERKRHSFWYSFKDEHGVLKEVIKARIKRGDDPNYWETSRPLSWAGMTPRDDNKRDKPLVKNVVYIDFRAELSAFDKYFYFGNVKGIKSKNKQEFIQKKSIQLKKVLSGQKSSYNTPSGITNKKPRHLTEVELNFISFILGKKYISGVFLEHSFFRNEGYSVIFKTSHAEYSEAFAGSGEVAVVRLVMLILDSSEYSLILLDEPEVSLHPGAQMRLKLFLLDRIKENKHQVVITSHSPSIVKGLPKEAIKAFYQNPSNGRFIIKENVTPEEAFYHIEYPINDVKNITVEDILAKEIITAVLDKLGPSIKNLFIVKYNPGGESVIKREFIPVYCREPFSREFIFFDGDQKAADPHFDWRDFPMKSLNVKFIQKKIKEQVNEEIKFSIDGGLSSNGDEIQQLELLKKYLDYYRRNVFYIPKKTPEDLIWDQEYSKKLIQIQNIENVANHIKRIDDIINAKKKFVEISEILYGRSKAEDIINIQKLFLKNWLNIANRDYEEIKDIVLSIISLP
jgi:predicted ATPase